MFLLFGMYTRTFSSENAKDSVLHLVETLMDNNLGYSQEMRANDIIQWEDTMVSAFREKQDYRHMFLMKQMAVYAYSFQGQITEALEKSNAMMAQARKMNYETGIALSFFALGDTYLNVLM